MQATAAGSPIGMEDARSLPELGLLTTLALLLGAGGDAYMAANEFMERPMDKAWLNDMARRCRINPIDILKTTPRLINYKGNDEGKGRAINDQSKRELADACLFCYGLSCRMGCPVLVVVDDREDRDYDFIAVWKNNEDNMFSPVQLKEVVPQRLNAQASIQSIIGKLPEQYHRSPDLTVAIRVNRHVELDLDKITIPTDLHIAALWIYGFASSDGSRCFLTGNLMEPAPDVGWLFDYPA
jgi:hypothetical protein